LTISSLYDIIRNVERTASRKKASALKIYKKLLKELGPQHWWPGESGFEIIIGAILAQATNWHNVELAISNLKKEKLLSVERIASNSANKIEKLIRPTGYFRQKAKRIQTFCRWIIKNYGSEIGCMLRESTPRLRESLLQIDGIGPETADSILLYAGNKPIFVVDEYTRRIFGRHMLTRKDAAYGAIQSYAMEHLPRDTQIFNELHALLVAAGKRFCKKTNPDCNQCPLGEFRHKI
jgi:endonuclease-3 related protein